MNDDNKIPLTTICARLERAIHCDVGMKGLDILIYGWRHKFKIRDSKLRMRKINDGETWLSYLELTSFSKYAGYDLTHD